jgi:hypothetical protein
MQRLHTILTVILGVALIVSLVVSRKSQQEFQRELHAVNDANGVLRERLGQLTIAITNKDKQIDHLLQSSCEVPGGEHQDSFQVPLPRQLKPAKPPTATPIGAN